MISLRASFPIVACRHAAAKRHLRSSSPQSFIPMRILVINPGASSTKIAVFENEQAVLVQNIQHRAEDLHQFDEVTDQYAFRRETILEVLEEAGLTDSFDAIIARGSLTRPLPGGVYAVNDALFEDTLHTHHQHPCNLGVLIAQEFRKAWNCPAFMADPAIVDELMPEARLSGLPELPRRSMWHALNHKAVARRFARERGCCYEDLRLIVCHLGSGTTVAAHLYGKAVDTNNGLDGEGAFSMFRAGSLPAREVINYCFEGGRTEKQVIDHIKQTSGIFAHLGTGDMRAVMVQIEQGDEQAALIVDAMLYHTAKEIAALGAALEGKVDAILLTGALTHAPYITERLRQRISFLAPVQVYPGEDEMQALAESAFGVLKGEREVHTYTSAETL